jgi:hypothetical protein
MMAGERSANAKVLDIATSERAMMNLFTVVSFSAFL